MLTLSRKRRIKLASAFAFAVLYLLLKFRSVISAAGVPFWMACKDGIANETLGVSSDFLCA